MSAKQHLTGFFHPAVGRGQDVRLLHGLIQSSHHLYSTTHTHKHTLPSSLLSSEVPFPRGVNRGSESMSHWTIDTQHLGPNPLNLGSPQNNFLSET